MENIKPGYQLHITSWENDADNYKTEVIQGLTKEDVQFYLHFLRHFYSSYCRYKDMIGPGYGNLDIDECMEAESIAITSAFEAFPPSSPQLLDDVKQSIEFWKENSRCSCDWVYKTIGTWGEGDRYRVFDSFEVYYIPTEIENVTDKFDDELAKEMEENLADCASSETVHQTAH